MTICTVGILYEHFKLLCTEWDIGGTYNIIYSSW